MRRVYRYAKVKRAPRLIWGASRFAGGTVAPAGVTRTTGETRSGLNSAASTYAGGGGGRERVASLRAQQRRAPGGPQAPPKPQQSVRTRPKPQKTARSAPPKPQKSV